MTSNSDHGLLTSRDARPARITNRGGQSWFLLLGDHAGNLIPERLGHLGLSPHELDRHIALDVGVSQLGQRLSLALDAPFVEQSYSRLVIDCNRATDHAESIVEISDGTTIPGNRELSRSSAEQRVEEIFHPYHAAIAALLAERRAASHPTILVSLHSFTPRLAGFERPWEIAVLHSEGNTRFALALLKTLQRFEGLVIGDNEPYRMDETDFTVPTHAFPVAIPYVEIEVRQNELSNDRGITRIIEILEKALTAAKADPEIRL